MTLMVIQSAKVHISKPKNFNGGLTLHKQKGIDKIKKPHIKGREEEGERECFSAITGQNFSVFITYQALKQQICIYNTESKESQTE